jgi:hypothetical protein
MQKELNSNNMAVFSDEGGELGLIVLIFSTMEYEKMSGGGVFTPLIEPIAAPDHLVGGTGMQTMEINCQFKEDHEIH